MSQPIPEPPTFPDGVLEITARATKEVGKVVMPRAFARVHPAIKKLFDADERRRQKGETSGYSWYRPLFAAPYEQRRLAILNALALAIGNAGGTLSTQGTAARDLYYRVGHVSLKATLDAARVQPPSEYSDSPRPPRNAKLVFKLERRTESASLKAEWTDEEGRPLEKQLQEIAVGLLVAGEWAYREGRVWRYEYNLERRAELEKEVRERAAEAERKEREQVLKLAAARRKQLIVDAANWRRAREIRDYVEAAMEQLGRAEGETNQWANWALAEADRMDPLVEGG